MNRNIAIIGTIVGLFAMSACTPQQIQEAIDIDAAREVVSVDSAPMPPQPIEVAPVDCTQPIPVPLDYLNHLGVYWAPNDTGGVTLVLNPALAPNCPTLPGPGDLLANRPRRGG